ncbi:MAG: undecaprenyldiphospho-muramoylpentapeptide beta-N-acetylglucosaminyltransferase [Candidatus Buchananbacteria bacterium]
MKIILTGGGTMGSVSPLLALYEEIKNLDLATEFLFIGTKTGPEKAVVEKYQIEFKAIWSGKLRRYLDWHNLVDPFLILVGLGQALKIIWQFRATVVVSAGSFVSVPVVIAAFLLRKKILIHQQDLRPGLANKICAPLADKITVTFPDSLKYYPAAKTECLGNPARQEILNCTKQRGLDFFQLSPDLPTLLVLGGGTGAQFINEVLVKALPELLQFCQIIHSSGRGKTIEGIEHSQYHNFEFLSTEMPEALAAADVVVSRAGLGTMTELSVLGKPTILIPIADSHQEDNALYYQKHNAALVIMQQFLTDQLLVKLVKELLRDPAALQNYSRNIKKMISPLAGQKIAKIIVSLGKN